MKTETAPSSVDFSTFRNPFQVDRLRSALRTLHETENALNVTRAALPHEVRESLTGNAEQRKTVSRVLMLAKLGAESSLATEAIKPTLTRFHSVQSGGQDDAWQVWVVLTREVSALVPDEETARQVWEALGFDARETGHDCDYSPSGRMFSRGLCAYRIGAHWVLRQSGSRDV